MLTWEYFADSIPVVGGKKSYDKPKKAFFILMGVICHNYIEKYFISIS